MTKSWHRNVHRNSFDHICRGGGEVGSRKSRLVGISPTFYLQVVAPVVAELPRTQRLSSSLRSYSKATLALAETMTRSFFLHPAAFIINKDISNRCGDLLFVSGCSTFSPKAKTKHTNPGSLSLSSSLLFSAYVFATPLSRWGGPGS